MSCRTYSELCEIDSFVERYRYLSLNSVVGTPTFGFDRYLNQAFYTSKEWRDVRMFVIARDLGYDLGVEDHAIFDRPIIHHMNPITIEDLVEGREVIVDPEFLITTSHSTHNAIHFGDESLLPRSLVERQPGDTRLW